MDRHEARLLPPRQLALATTGVMLAMFLSIFSQTIVATAMPRIIADLGDLDRYTWAERSATCLSSAQGRSRCLSSSRCSCVRRSMQPSEFMGPTGRAIVVRNGLNGSTALIVLSIGAVGMTMRAGLRDKLSTISDPWSGW